MLPATRRLRAAQCVQDELLRAVQRALRAATWRGVRFLAPLPPLTAAAAGPSRG
jgi:hypothetical protein